MIAIGIALSLLSLYLLTSFLNRHESPSLHTVTHANEFRHRQTQHTLSHTTYSMPDATHMICHTDTIPLPP